MEETKRNILPGGGEENEAPGEAGAADKTVDAKSTAGEEPGEGPETGIFREETADFAAGSAADAADPPEEIPLCGTSDPTEEVAKDGEVTGGGDPEPDIGAGSEEVYRQRAEEDYRQICRSFPEVRAAGDLFGIANLSRYAELREAGLSAPEAYAAAHYTRIGRAPMPDSRAHLSSSLGRGAAPAHAGMSAGEMASARELFPTLSDREIGALYLRASGNRNK